MDQIEKTFRSFQGQNILVVGDVMLDRYIYGSADRISPEAPVPVVHLKQQENRLGGAANVALNLKALGANPYLCSVIGKDDNAAKMLELLPGQGLSAKGIIQSGERITTVKTRVIASNQHLLRVDNEDQHLLSNQEANALKAAVIGLLEAREIHAILFQDYNKGVLSKQVIRDIMLEAIKRDIPTAVDPKHDNFWAYKHVTLFKPNLKEIRAKVPFRIEPELGALREAAQHIRSQLGNRYALITLSEQGLFYESKQEASILPTQPRLIADVCGAGDTVFAIAGIGLSLNMPLSEIALLSNLAGGQVCEKVGVVPVDATQLQKEYTLLKSTGSLT
jgi:rfaE bifunctional protein kinase chain/domain